MFQITVVGKEESQCSVTKACLTMGPVFLKEVIVAMNEVDLNQDL